MGALSAEQVREQVRLAAISPLALLEGLLHTCRADADSLVGLFAEPDPATTTASAGSTVTTSTSAPSKAAVSTEVGAAAVTNAQELNRTTLAQMLEVATDFFRAEGWPTPEALDELVEHLQSTFAAAEPVLVARVLALALSEQCHDLIRAEFDMHATGAVLNDRVIPLPASTLYEAYRLKFGRAVHLTPQPGHMFSDVFHIDRTLRFRLCTPPTGVTVHAYTGFSDELDALERIPVAASAAPLGPTIPRTRPAPSANGSFGHGPLDEDDAWRLAKEMLVKAATVGVDVVVVPELNIGSGIQPDLTTEDVPALVLCGSRHRVTTSGHQVNEATVHVNGVHAITHHKMHPFQDLVNASKGEDIVCGRRVELLFSHTWTIAVLVCADVNLADVNRLVEDLGVNLLLVTSMTTKPGVFESSLRQISERNQALVVWANDPITTSTVDTAMFFFPSATHAVAKKRYPLPRLARHTWSRPT